ncbi:MAG: YebC/PmpR family DNA-binding transcriptional regulator [Rhodothermales bacterium]|nr:YebC/PmpR family DNA-binding transcriptional regulator [Rhodothermales bacterium]
MAGHNKWSKIKRKKGVADARRSKVWARMVRDIMIAAREGGGDPEMNARLALAVEKAKAENMPKDNIERAIKRGTGEIEGADYEEMTYEGYGPGGVAFFVECLTDNTNRTVADVRHAFSKHGGNLGTSGSVAYLFERKGLIEVPAEGADGTAIDEDELFLVVAEAGAEDLRREEGTFVVTTPVDAFAQVQEAVEAAGIEPAEAALARIPTTTTRLDAEEAAKALRLVEALEDLQDVQEVYTTLELDEATAAALSE